MTKIFRVFRGCHGYLRNMGVQHTLTSSCLWGNLICYGSSPHNADSLPTMLALGLLHPLMHGFPWIWLAGLTLTFDMFAEKQSIFFSFFFASRRKDLSVLHNLVGICIVMCRCVHSISWWHKKTVFLKKVKSFDNQWKMLSKRFFEETIRESITT